MSQCEINPSSVTVAEGRKKRPKPSLNCSFFATSSPPFLPPQSLFPHSLRTCDRLQTGWEGRTMCCDPPAQHQAPALTPRRLWGGEWEGATPSSRLRPLPTNPATSRINRSATAYKRCSGVHASLGRTPPAVIGLLERAEAEEGNTEARNNKPKLAGNTVLWYQ